MTTKLAQENKKNVWNFWQELNNAKADNIANVIQSYAHKNVAWYGPHPINELNGVDALITDFWQPLMRPSLGEQLLYLSQIHS